MVLAAWLDAAEEDFMFQQSSFAVTFKPSIFVCRNPISLVPFSAEVRILLVLKFFIMCYAEVQV